MYGKFLKMWMVNQCRLWIIKPITRQTNQMNHLNMVKCSIKRFVQKIDANDYDGKDYSKVQFLRGVSSYECNLILNPCETQWQLRHLPDGERQFQRWGSQPNILAKFPQKLHENEENWTLGGGAPLVLFLGSATEINWNWYGMTYFLSETRILTTLVSHMYWVT